MPSAITIEGPGGVRLGATFVRAGKPVGVPETCADQCGCGATYWRALQCSGAPGVDLYVPASAVCGAGGGGGGGGGSPGPRQVFRYAGVCWTLQNDVSLGDLVYHVCANPVPPPPNDDCPELPPGSAYVPPGGALLELGAAIECVDYPCTDPRCVGDWFLCVNCTPDITTNPGVTYAVRADRVLAWVALHGYYVASTPDGPKCVDLSVAYLDEELPPDGPTFLRLTPPLPTAASQEFKAAFGTSCCDASDLTIDPGVNSHLPACGQGYTTARVPYARCDRFAFGDESDFGPIAGGKPASALVDILKLVYGINGTPCVLAWARARVGHLPLYVCCSGPGQSLEIVSHLENITLGGSTVVSDTTGTIPRSRVLCPSGAWTTPFGSLTTNSVVNGFPSTSVQNNLRFTGHALNPKVWQLGSSGLWSVDSYPFALPLVSSFEYEECAEPGDTSTLRNKTLSVSFNCSGWSYSFFGEKWGRVGGTGPIVKVGEFAKSLTLTVTGAVDCSGCADETARMDLTGGGGEEAMSQAQRDAIERYMESDPMRRCRGCGG